MNQIELNESGSQCTYVANYNVNKLLLRVSVRARGTDAAGSVQKCWLTTEFQVRNCQLQSAVSTQCSTSPGANVLVPDSIVYKKIDKKYLFQSEEIRKMNNHKVEYRMIGHYSMQSYEYTLSLSIH